jgi:hypothetical protein
MSSRRWQGVDKSVVEELLHEGCVRSLPHGLEISDQRLRAVVYHSMTEHERHILHDEIAQACGSEDVQLRIWHSSFVRPDEDTAGELLSAAVELVRSGWILCGLEYAERAFALSGRQVPSRPVERLSESLTLQCRYTLARRYLRALQGRSGTDELSPAVMRLRILVDFTELSLINDQRVAKVIERYVESSPEACARLLATVGFCYIEQWDVENARKVVEQISETLGPEADLTQAVTIVLELFAAAVSGRDLPGREELERASKKIRRSFPVEFSWILIAQALSLADRFDEARPLLNNLSDQASHLTPLWAKFSRITALNNENRAGNFHKVRELDELISAGLGNSDNVSVNDRIRDARMALLDGRFEEATAAVQSVRRLTAQGSNRLIRCQLAVLQARIAMLECDFQNANRHFARAHRLSTWLPSPHLLRYLDDFAESRVYADDIAGAKTIVAELEHAQRTAPTKWTE